MAVVISLAPRRRARPSRDQAQRPDPATILFFTGVRYERQGEAVAELAAEQAPHARSSAPVRPKRSRKAIRNRQPA